MNFLTTWLSLFFSYLCIVTSIDIPVPVFEVTSSPTNLSTTHKLIYIEEPNVTVKCFLPMKTNPEDVYLKLVIDNFEPNPVEPNEALSISEKVGKMSILLDIKYNPRRFVPLVSISCHAVNRTTGETENSSSIVIVQNYKTMTVLHDESRNIKVEAGGKVWLECLADGNPKPHYQWYNRTTHSDVRMEFANQRILEFVTPTNWSTTSLYVCRAGNEYNEEDVKGEPVSVSSIVIPELIIQGSPPPNNDSTADRLIYLEERSLNVTCSVPASLLPDGFEVELLYGVTEWNPFFGRDHGYPEVTLINKAQLEVVFHRIILIPSSYFICTASVRTDTKWKTLSIKVIHLDQHYRTMHASIDHKKGNMFVESGEKAVLTCQADGNPLPQQYRWYNRTEHGDIEFRNETGQRLEFVVSENWLAQSVIVCATKNRFNNDSVKSPSVTVIHVPPPVFESTPPANTSMSQKLIFMEESRISVKCSLPINPMPDDIYVEIVIEGAEHNPVNPTANTKIQLNANQTQVDIEYYQGIFIPLINISCRAVNRNTHERKKPHFISIEQQYRTMYVFSLTSSVQIVDAGETVKIVCKADGNPKPKYQWYNKTENSDDIELENATRHILEFTTPSNWSTSGLYSCGAWNEYNVNVVKADPISVTSFFIPSPQFVSNPSPTKDSTKDKFVFHAKPTVTMTCTEPMITVPEYVRLNIAYQQIQLNPIYPSETANIIVDEKKEEITLKIEYQPGVFVSLIEVECQSFNGRKGEWQTTRIQIEQQYPTMNVIINSTVNGTVEPDSTVELDCVADGNPVPQYQWFKMTKAGLEKLSGAAQPNLQINVTEDASYFCGAKNNNNVDFMHSASVNVSVNIPPPRPTPSGGNSFTVCSTWILLLTAIVIGLNNY